jgi:hypothetical protein
MAPRKTTNTVAEPPELDHSELVIFSGDGVLLENQPAKYRFPIINGGHGFEIITSFSTPSPVPVRVNLWRYSPSSPSGELVSQHDTAAGTITHYHPTQLEFERLQQVGFGLDLLDAIAEEDEPAEGIIIILRIAT